MRAKKGFNLRQVCGETIVVGEGKENIDFSNIISMNETSAYLWDKVKDGHEFTAEELAELLTEQYEVEYATALADSQKVMKQWAEAGIAE